MKIAVFSTHVLWSRHFETQLEIMQRHLAGPDGRANEVHEYACDRRLLCCDMLTARRVNARTTDLDAVRRLFCSRCVRTRKKGVSLIEGNRTERPIVSGPPPDVQFNYTTLEDLGRIKIDDFLLGRGVLSTLISAGRDVHVDIHRLRPVIDDGLRSALHLYSSATDYLQREKYDLAYIFNGRFAHTHALVAACRRVGVEFYTHELGGDREHYSLFHNSTPHDFDAWVCRIEEEWNSEPDLEKKKRIASTFYTERARGQSQEGPSFVKAQRPNLLPEDWDPKKTNLAIYTSSEDEFAAVEDDGYKNPIYQDQLDALNQIVADPRIRQAADLKIYVRIHPNLSYLENKNINGVLRLHSSQVCVIPAESAVSSYKLLSECSKALCFGSTVGAEATFWAKPSILAGVAPYRSHDVTYNPSTHSELIDLLLADLPAKPRDNALKYGYHRTIRGIKYRYFEPFSYLHGRFKGQNLEFYRDTWIRAVLKTLFPSLKRSVLVQRIVRLLNAGKNRLRLST